MAVRGDVPQVPWGGGRKICRARNNLLAFPLGFKRRNKGINWGWGWMRCLIRGGGGWTLRLRGVDLCRAILYPMEPLAQGTPQTPPPPRQPETGVLRSYVSLKLRQLSRP